MSCVHQYSLHYSNDRIQSAGECHSLARIYFQIPKIPTVSHLQMHHSLSLTALLVVSLAVLTPAFFY